MKTTKKWNKMFPVGMLGMALSGIVLTGCLSVPKTPVVYDSSQSQQEQSMIIIGAHLYFTQWGFTRSFKGSFDEKEVKWVVGYKVLIPSGAHTLEYNYYTESAEYNKIVERWAEGMRITHDFKPGYVYSVGCVRQGANYSPVITEIGILPWKIPSVSNEPTKLEGTWKSTAETIVFSGNTMVTARKVYKLFGTGTQYTKSVFSLTDQVITWQTFETSTDQKKWVPSEFGSLPQEFKYSFEDDGGLVLIVGTNTLPPLYKH